MRFLLEHFPPYLAVLLITVGVFVVFVLSLLAGLWFGTLRSRCSCRMAKQVLHEYESREKQAKEAAAYDPKKVDPGNLPLLPASSEKTEKRR